MHLYIRADANGKIGAGHVMRCIALAQAWQDQGGEVTFISHCESKAMKERIIQEGFQIAEIENPYPDPDDLSRTLECLKRQSPFTVHHASPWLVLDGYHFTTEYQKAIRDAGIRLLVIDDMNHLPHYHADMLLNQNINASELPYKCDDNTTMLMGTQYALLRREFLKNCDCNRHIPEQAKKVLVTFGGADPDNVTLRVIEALKLLNYPEMEVKIIVGPANPYRATLSEALISTSFFSELLINPQNMPELMAWADIAISAGGSTCWELAYMRVPSLIMTFADNQEGIARGLGDKEAMINLGPFDKNSIIDIAKSINNIINASQCRINLSHNGKDLVDGRGVLRVKQSIRDKTIMDTIIGS